MLVLNQPHCKNLFKRKFFNPQTPSNQVKTFIFLALLFTPLALAAVQTQPCAKNEVCISPIGTFTSTSFTPVEIQQYVPTAAKTSFIEKASQQAQQARQKYCFSASVAIAQAMLESRSGTSSLAFKYGNYFGIKDGINADTKCGGRVGEHRDQGYVCLYTKENQGTSKQETRVAAFKIFDAASNPFEEYAKFVSKPRYSRALASPCVNNYACYAREIHNAGYATDSDYSSKVIGLVKRYKLTDYDKAC